jgi:hypothetical protein
LHYKKNVIYLYTFHFKAVHMYKYCFIIFIFWKLAFAGEYLLIDYAVIPNHNKMVITWKVSNENNIKQFNILRSTDDKNFIKIASVEAKGSGEYTYYDSFMGKTAQTLFYKIRIIDKNNKTVEESRSLTGNINLSGIKSTWGAIKAMFR